MHAILAREMHQHISGKEFTGLSIDQRNHHRIRPVPRGQSFLANGNGNRHGTSTPDLLTISLQ